MIPIGAATKAEISTGVNSVFHLLPS